MALSNLNTDVEIDEIDRKLAKFSKLTLDELKCENVQHVVNGLLDRRLELTNMINYMIKSV